MKTMANTLPDSTVTDQTLVLNLLCGLSPRYAHLRAILMCITPFSSFARVCDDLLLEELTIAAATTSDVVKALYSGHPGVVSMGLSSYLR